MGALQSRIGDRGAASLAEALEEICSSDELSLELLRDNIHAAQPHQSSDAIIESNFLHKACMNERVTLEVVEFLLDAFPGAAGRKAVWRSPSSSYTDGESIYSGDSSHYEDVPAYPLHLACRNESCPNSVVELLAKEYPPALKDEFRITGCYNVIDDDGMNGLPLHHYLGRASNMSLAAVKTLVDMYPESLEVFSPYRRCEYTPIRIFLNNPNIAGLDDIARYLAESSPSSLEMIDAWGTIPLHTACENRNMDPSIVQVLLECWPNSAFERNEDGWLPLHYLCSNEDLGDKAGTEILRMLIDINPDSLMDYADGQLPIHIAASGKPPGFIRALIGYDPGLVRAESEDGCGLLPIHAACFWGRLDTVKYLLELLPQSINIHDAEGYLPIHRAAQGQRARNAKIIAHLLSVDPNGAAKVTTGSSSLLPLKVAMHPRVHIDVVATLFDAFPHIITLMGMARTRGLPEEVRAFLEEQQRYRNKAHDIDALSTPDPDGQLPLHRALRENASLGAIKVLVKGTLMRTRSGAVDYLPPCDRGQRLRRNAVQVADRWGAYPLHIACAYSSAAVVRYLAELDDTILGRRDSKRNTTLHFACREANLGVVRHLLESSFVEVSERNDDDKLPIHLLCEVAGDKVDSESREFVEAVWLLLLAHPETVGQMLDQSDAKREWEPVPNRKRPHEALS